MRPMTNDKRYQPITVAYTDQYNNQVRIFESIDDILNHIISFFSQIVYNYGNINSEYRLYGTRIDKIDIQYNVKRGDDILENFEYSVNNSDLNNIFPFYIGGRCNMKRTLNTLELALNNFLSVVRYRTQWANTSDLQFKILLHQDADELGYLNHSRICIECFRSLD